MVKNIIIVVLVLVILFLLFFINKPQKLHENIVVKTDTIWINNNKVIEKADGKQIEKTNDDLYKNADLTYKIINSKNNTFGYDIYIEDKMFLHQPNIPGIPGNEGFKTKEKAIRIALLVISKIRKNGVMPGISMEELIKVDAL